MGGGQEGAVGTEMTHSTHLEVKGRFLRLKE